MPSAVIHASSTRLDSHGAGASDVPHDPSAVLVGVDSNLLVAYRPKSDRVRVDRFNAEWSTVGCIEVSAFDRTSCLCFGTEKRSRDT